MGFNCYFLHRQMCVLQQVGCGFNSRTFCVKLASVQVRCTCWNTCRAGFATVGGQGLGMRDGGITVCDSSVLIAQLPAMSHFFVVQTSWLLSSHSHYLWQQSLLPGNIQIHAKTIYSEVQFNKKYLQVEWHRSTTGVTAAGFGLERLLVTQA